MIATEPKAYGTFIKKGNYIFRTSAYLQWGDSEKSVGACLLLNPGSAKLDDEISSVLEVTGFASGLIKCDPTMKQLISLVEKIYGKDVSGRLHIYNLFNLKYAQSENAVNLFENLVQTGQYNITDSLVSLEELKTHPWILLGWGVKRESRWVNLELIKKQWKQLILESEIPSFGKKHPKRDDYDHPCPLISTKRGVLLEELVSIYKNQFDTYVLGNKSNLK